MSEIESLFTRFRENIGRVMIGQDRVVRELFIGVICKGHVLLEGVPGVAKTLLAKSVARCLDLRFARIQFTPDLMPSDIVGTNIYNFETRQFVLQKGPIFTDVLLCDEINRTPPKTQAALLESMEETQATIDGTIYPLPPLFFVIATQNPLEHEGTYPLPEAQVDRFFMKIYMGNSNPEEMRKILERFSKLPDQQKLLLNSIQALISSAELLKLREQVFSVRVDEKILNYIAALYAETQSNPLLLAGLSPRAALHLFTAARAHAAISGRGFVTPDDVKAIAFPILSHRLLIKADAEFEGITAKQLLGQIFEKVPVPK